jgi:O-acetyl-ADP-ribose deacetylase (regulator of RNase III)
MLERAIGERVLALRLGDITTIPADAIVNAANERLVGGGGVDGAIHRAGGPEIMADLVARYGRMRRCPTGSAVVSTAGRLPARWIIHAVGPIWLGGGHGEADQLASAFRIALRLASELGVRTVLAPAISTGVYGYPWDAAARISLAAVAEHLSGDTTVERVTFVLRPGPYEAFVEALAAFEWPTAG